MATEKKGFVYLVGAGPGDPDLLTVKALRLLQNADVVVFDRLVGKGILELIPAGTARIYAGKSAGRHAQPQEETNSLLVSLAAAGHHVVRLKGGDPLIFGRGSEEALFLAQQGIACEFVPGVTAASGCAARAGIPLSHRGLASGVRFVTGHCRNDEPLDLNWHSLADPDTTLAIYMGLGHIGEIACRLIEHGLASDTPAAAIANATWSEEKVVTGTLASLPDLVQQAELTAPVLFIVGRVVEIRDSLAVAQPEGERESMACRTAQVSRG